MTLAAIASAAAMLLALAAVPARAQTSAAETWTTSVDAYLDGRLAESIAFLALPPDAISSGSRQAVEQWMARARAAVDGPGGVEARRRAVRRLQASALLPLEVLLPISASPRSIESVEALEHAAIDAWEHLAPFEGMYLDAPADPQRKARAETRARLQRFRARWRVALLQYLANVGRYPDFMALAATAARDIDGDPRARTELYLLQGIVAETAARRTQEPRRTFGPVLPNSRLRDAAHGFDAAQRWYRQALETTPSHAEATLRLGRTLLERGKPDEAIATLATVAAAACREATCGLAWLFTGEAHDLRAAAADAAAAYARASGVLAVRQSALVAWMQLALRNGSAGGDGLIGQFLVERPLARLEDPDAWSTYSSGRRTNADAVLAPCRVVLLP